LRKIDYLFNCIRKHIKSEGFRCPNCGASGGAIVDRKYLVTSLRRCASCLLLYRTPTDSADENKIFYNEEYKQGLTTDIPNDDRINELISSQFVGSDVDYTQYINILSHINPGKNCHLFEYGCSWGYGSWQLSNAGFDVTAHEISRVRSQVAAEKLGVNTDDDPEALSLNAGHEKYDVFFSSHVLEHVPSPSSVVALAWDLLRDGGYFVSITPNGSVDNRNVNPLWRKVWGRVHPNFIDDMFLDSKFSKSARFFASSPFYNENFLDIDSLTVKRNVVRDLKGNDLLLMARKNKAAGSF